MFPFNLKKKARLARWTSTY